MFALQEAVFHEGWYLPAGGTLLPAVDNGDRTKENGYEERPYTLNMPEV